MQIKGEKFIRDNKRISLGAGIGLVFPCPCHARNGPGNLNIQKHVKSKKDI